MENSRRNALKKMVVLGASMSLAPELFAQEKVETCIENAKVFLGSFLENINIGITKEGKIILDKRKIRAKNYIDATGLIASSGFVDILSGSLEDKDIDRQIEKNALKQGVTTLLQLKHTHQEANLQKSYFAQGNHSLHYGAGISVSDFYKLNKNKKQTSYFIEQSLDYSSLYLYALWQPHLLPFEELLHFTKIAGAKNCPLILRFPVGINAEESIKIVIELAKKSGTRIHIEHLHRIAKADAMLKSLEKIQEANWLGLNITASVYPQMYWKNYLQTIKEKMQKDSLELLEKEDSLLLEKLENDTIAIEKPEENFMIAFQESIKAALETNFCLIMPEYDFSAENYNPYPLLTALQYSLNIGLSLEKILGQITLMPAILLGNALKNRASIRENHWADLVLFDPRELKKQNLQKDKSSTIKYVFLEGKLVLKNQNIKGFYGKFISKNLV